MLACKRQQLLANGGILLKVKDWNFLGGDDPMGEVFVKAQELLEGKGELKEYKIKPPKGFEGLDAGTLTIRYRKGTRADYESLKNKEKKCLFVPLLDKSIPEKLSIMIEIQSARNVLIGDTTTSDPYVLVKAGDKQIHKTSKIMKT
jgi:C2 domain